MRGSFKTNNALRGLCKLEGAFGYRSRGPIRSAEPGSLEHFLSERYRLYADDGRARADIHHAPWPLQEADGEVALQTVSPVPLEGEPLLHYAGRLDVLIWPLAPAL